MFARVSTIEGKPEKADAGIRHYKEQMIPAARKMAGFKKALLMIDRQTGKMVGITFWDSEKNLQASTAEADKLRAQGTQTAGTGQPPRVEIYEVAVEP